MIDLQHCLGGGVGREHKQVTKDLKAYYSGGKIFMFLMEMLTRLVNISMCPKGLMTTILHVDWSVHCRFVFLREETYLGVRSVNG